MKKEDMIGQRFGRLVVLEQDFDYAKVNNLKSNQNYWKCQCDCGKYKTVVHTSLVGGKTKSCGCLNQEKRLSQKEDLLGQVFGKLTVIASAEKISNRSAWLCECECGNRCVVLAVHLKSGNTKSCGCLVTNNFGGQNKLDLTNQKFGRLTVLYPTEKRSNGSVVWMCQCECGNFKEVSAIHLTRGNTQSCGCLVSLGESEIINILQQNNINFETQKSFEDAFEIEGHPYRYDFYLPDYNRLIEFDGEQHFKFRDTGWNNLEHFKDTQRRDRLKNIYALSKNIELVRIPYIERKNITLDLLLGNKYLVTET